MPRLARSQFNSTPATKCNKTPPEQPALPETCATHARAPMQPHDNVVYAPQVNADCRGSESASGRGCSAIRKEPRLPEDAGIHQHALTRRASRVIMHTGTRSVRERKRERERYPLITSIHGCGRNPPPLPASPSRSRDGRICNAKDVARSCSLSQNVCTGEGAGGVGHFLISEPRLQVIR